MIFKAFDRSSGEPLWFDVLGFDRNRPILKADDEEQPGDRWISVGEEGSKHPVLLRPVKGHEGAYHVVGGAGGKLNGLKIVGIKSPEEYRQQAMAKAKEKRAQEKAELAKLTPEERAQRKAEKVAQREGRMEAERQFATTVLGPAPEVQLPEGASPEEIKKAVSTAHRERLKLAHKIAKDTEKKVLLDAELRMASGLGTSQPKDAAALGTVNIDDVVTQKGLAKGPGYQRPLGELAEKNGLTAEALADAVQDIRERSALEQGKPLPPKPGPPGAEIAAGGAESFEENQKVQQEIKALKAAQQEAVRQAIQESIDANGTFAEVLKARATLRQAYREAVSQATGRVFEPGFQMVMAEPDMDQIVDTLEEKYLTGAMNEFLDEVEREHPSEDYLNLTDAQSEEGLHATRGAAAFDALHEVALATMGQGAIERDTVEVLGPEGAAQVMARAIRQAFTPEDQKQILAALEEHHVSDQKDSLASATAEAAALREKAHSIELDLAGTAKDLAVAAEMTHNKLEVLKEARRILGGTLGRLEARAALIAALRESPKDTITVPMGKMDPRRAVQTAAALGLKAGDYQIDHALGEATLTLKPEGQDRLIAPVDQAARGEREIALAIKQGQLDQQGYIPQGFANRTPSRYDNPLQEPPVFRSKLEIPEGTNLSTIRDRIESHIGSRIADGERPADIARDLTSATTLSKFDPETAKSIIDEAKRIFPPQVAETDSQGNKIPVIDKTTGKPIRDPKGNLVYKMRNRAADESLPELKKMAGTFLEQNGHSGDMAFHTQSVDFDHPDFREATHRALADDPRARAAFIPTAELSGDHQKAIRDFFYSEVAKVDPKAEGAGEAQKAALEAIGPEPPKFSSEGSLFDDLGMDPVETPEWIAWNQKRQQALSTPATSAWADYVKHHGGLRQAQEAVQDIMKGRFLEKFQGHYQHATGRVLKTGSSKIRGGEKHVAKYGSDEDKGAAKAEKQQVYESLKNKQKDASGKYGFGSIADKYEDHLAQTKAAQEAQSALFGDDEEESTGPAKIPATERFSLGEVIEKQLSNAMPNAAKPFEGMSKGVKVKEGMNMDGQYVAQQRGIHALHHLKKMGLFYGAGSGKTSVMLGGLTSLHAQGKLKKAILAVPSVVQAQFGAEAVNFIDPGSGFNVHAHPGETFEERLAAYRDPGKHAVVVTHQALRDDTLDMLGTYKQMAPADVRAWVKSAPKEELAKAIKEAFHAHGIDHNALMVDEGHNALNRKGKEDSTLAQIVDAHGHNAEYYVGATGSPVKNDPSEAFDWLQKIDPARYPASKREEFLRRYGVDTPLTRRSMKMELSRYFFSDRVHPGVGANHHEVQVPLSAPQHTAIAEVERAVAKLRTGDPDVTKWAKMLAPEAFEGHPEAEHAEIAEKVKKANGTYRESRMDAIINAHPDSSAKVDVAVDKAKEYVAQGKPMVIFAHRLQAVDQLHAALEKAGLKVTSITGKHSAAEKARRAAAFMGTPDGGAPSADVIVLSDAASTGLNLQRGKALVHFDQPMTYMTHEQRSARIHRLGQTEDVDIINLLADHPYDAYARARVKRKEMLAGIYQSPAGYIDDGGFAETLQKAKARANQTEAEDTDAA